VKSLWSPGVPKAGPNSSDTSKALFARDIWKFESSQPSHAVFKPNGTSSHLARLAAVDRNYIAAHLVDKSH
jgi:hypothetical protein